MDYSTALKLIAEIPIKSDGVWFQLRAGRDPGVDRLNELLLALDVAWQATHDRDRLPRSLAFGAACILHFSGEAQQNASSSELRLYVRRLQMAAFALFAGPAVHEFDIRRSGGEPFPG